MVDPERTLSLTPLTLVWLLEAGVGLWDVRHRPAALALEGRLDNLRAHVCRLPDDPLDGDQRADVVVDDPDVPDVDRVARGQPLEPDVCLSE